MKMTKPTGRTLAGHPGSSSSNMTASATTTQGAGEEVVLLSGGNPQIAKGYGDERVQKYIEAMPGWKRHTGELLDQLIVQAVPSVEKAVKWNSPLYGVEKDSWFLGFHCLTNYVKVAFFRGDELSPKPPGSSKQRDVRYLDIYENDELNETQFNDWVLQASRALGEKM